MSIEIINKEWRVKKLKCSYKIESKPFSEVADADISLSLQPFILFSERCNYSCYSTLMSYQNNFIFSLYIIIESLRAHSGVSNSVTQLDYSLPGSSVHGTFQKECWIELPLPTPRGLPEPEIKLVSPALAGNYLSLNHLGPCIIH